MIKNKKYYIYLLLFKFYMMEDLEETINHTITRKVFRNSE